VERGYGSCKGGVIYLVDYAHVSSACVSYGDLVGVRRPRQYDLQQSFLNSQH
jgi:hypothetical protein